MRTVLVTGASGLLGAHVAAALRHSCRVVGVDRHPWWGDCPMDVRQGRLESATRLRELIADVQPNLVVHCAAMVDVDACEQDPARAYEGNAQLTRQVVRALPAGCRMVLLSTDSLFRGDTPFATEATLPCPRTVYARSKLHAEWEVQQASDAHLIVRTNFYGWSSGRKKTFGEWLYRALSDREPITLFDDFFSTPLYVMDCVGAILALLEGNHRGMFHVASRDRISKYEFGRLLAEAAGLPFDHVRRGRLADAALPAPRPHDMSLSSAAYEAAIGARVPSVADGVRRFLADRERPLSQRVRPREPAAVEVWV